jgi:DNA-binding NtrC family response regulator
LEHFERANKLAVGGALSIRAATAIGVVWTDENRLIEAEAALRSAHAGAEVLLEPSVIRKAALALARCLLWQGRHSEAIAVVDRELTRETPACAWALAARVHLAAGNRQQGMAAAIEAARIAERSGAMREVAIAARAMAMARASVGDIDGVRDAVTRGVRAAAQAHLPLHALRLRAVLLFALASSSSQTTEFRKLLAHMRAALGRPLPDLLRQQLLAACDTGSRLAVEVPPSSANPLSNLHQFLEIAQVAADDHRAAEEICDALCKSLRAATTQIVATEPDIRLLAHAGRPWHGDDDVARRTIASGAVAASDAEPLQVAVTIRYGVERIAALVCRWSAGTAIDQTRVGHVLETAALAVAPNVRGLLDRGHPLQFETSCGDLLGNSPAAVKLRDAIARAARAPFSVLIEGESGSGKELVARAIHRLGPRRDRRLCTINCAAISDELLEAELFGHARGAFTGAMGERAGLFEEADGGTLFLDEVGELSARAQAKLLRVLQDGEIRRVGENLPRRVDTRVIAATNRNLEQEVEKGRFRADLRFRLDVVRISVPPLRDRATDIPALAAHFWQDAATRVGSRATLTPETVAALTRYDWPGNVRELQNTIAALAVHAPRRGRIAPALLPAHLAQSGVPGDATFEAARAEFERRFVRAALARAGGQRSRAARALGVTRQGLAKMMRRLQIDV